MVSVRLFPLTPFPSYLPLSIYQTPTHLNLAFDSRLQANWGPEMTASLIERHPALSDPESLAIFKRKWEYLFFYAEVGYARAYTHYTHFTFARPVRLFLFLFLMRGER